MKPPGITAADLLKEMANDPVISRRLAERAARLEMRVAKSRAILEPVVRKIQDLGFAGETIEGIVKLNAPLPECLVETLLSCLRELPPAEQETLVRALGAAAHPFDGIPLIDLFRKASDYALRWAIANTMALAKPRGMQEWLDAIRGTTWEETFAALSRAS